jgi:4-amino-4-deoxy-L-arabinose transferase-like glycosyltransferase
MLERGDWIVPVFNAELRTHKPVLLYWLILLSYSVLGVSEWSARLPSAVLAVGTVLCTYAMGRRLFSARAGYWAGVMLATSLLFVMASRAATPDAALIFFSTLAVTLFVRAAIPAREEPASGLPAVASDAGPASFPGQRSAAAAIYGAMGAAMLAKGPHVPPECQPNFPADRR